MIDNDSIMKGMLHSLSVHGDEDIHKDCDTCMDLTEQAFAEEGIELEVAARNTDPNFSFMAEMAQDVLEWKARKAGIETEESDDDGEDIPWK